MVQKLNDTLYSWASIVDPNTIEQAERTARLPIVHGHVALMADAHYGLGATVGSVVPTKGAIIPSCVGVDIGCGMAAVETDLTSADLPDSLDGYAQEGPYDHRQKVPGVQERAYHDRWRRQPRRTR